MKSVHECATCPLEPGPLEPTSLEPTSKTPKKKAPRRKRKIRDIDLTEEVRDLEREIALSSTSEASKSPPCTKDGRTLHGTQERNEPERGPMMLSACKQRSVSMATEKCDRGMVVRTGSTEDVIGHNTVPPAIQVPSHSLPFHPHTSLIVLPVPFPPSLLTLFLYLTLFCGGNDLSYGFLLYLFLLNEYYCSGHLPLLFDLWDSQGQGEGHARLNKVEVEEIKEGAMICVTISSNMSQLAACAELSFCTRHTVRRRVRVRPKAERIPRGVPSEAGDLISRRPVGTTAGRSEVESKCATSRALRSWLALSFKRSSLSFKTQQSVKCFSTLKPSGVISIDRKACRHMHLLMNFLGPNTNVRKRAALVKRPAINMVSMMQLVKDLEPVV
ncbi:hypothetical protein EDB84DRAFT_1445021 [Lactarius hengduanensis]|nr:hypothetical protein EDB84DRAFT_1445021 [Lactarius hengduanensis]